MKKQMTDQRPAICIMKKILLKTQPVPFPAAPLFIKIVDIPVSFIHQQIVNLLPLT